MNMDFLPIPFKPLRPAARLKIMGLALWHEYNTITY